MGLRWDSESQSVGINTSNHTSKANLADTYCKMKRRSTPTIRPLFELFARIPDKELVTSTHVIYEFYPPMEVIIEAT